MTELILTENMRAEIDKELAKFPSDKKRSAALMAVRIVQDLGNNSITTEQLDAIADYLDMAPIEMYEVATFYTMCKREPVGRHHIGVCTNISCMLNGAEDIANHFKNRLHIDYNQVTPDGKFSLEEVECMGACINAPMCQIGKKYHEHLTPEKVDELLNELK